MATIIALALGLLLATVNPINKTSDKEKIKIVENILYLYINQ